MIWLLCILHVYLEWLRWLDGQRFVYKGLGFTCLRIHVRVIVDFIILRCKMDIIKTIFYFVNSSSKYIVYIYFSNMVLSSASCVMSFTICVVGKSSTILV